MMPTRKTITLLCIAGCSGLAGCFLLERGRYVDPRTDRPEPVVFDESSQTLPGKTIAGPGEVEGIWVFFRMEQRAHDGSGPPLFYYSLFLKLDSDNRYELVYHAYWGSRGPPGRRAVEVREAGRFSLAGDLLRLHPNGTQLTETQSGQHTTRTIADENREYLAALDGAYLSIAGPCAGYQVEPICQHNRDVWYSLRLGVLDWPVPPLQ